MNERQEWDARRDYVIAEDAVSWAAEHWVGVAKRAIQQRGRFAVALSGGSTPKAIYEQLARKHRDDVDWSKVWLFWSDERAVPPESAESNYKMAMDAGFASLGLVKSQVFRMYAEAHVEKNAAEYEKVIHEHVGPHGFDLVMLGVGEDGHTASLFPHGEALGEKKHWVRAVYVEAKKSWRMTLTLPCINGSALAVVYALGAGKAAVVPLVLKAAVVSSFPASAVGTVERKALWVLDGAAAQLLK